VRRLYTNQINWTQPHTIYIFTTPEIKLPMP
jgi:hypothetical protein